LRFPNSAVLLEGKNKPQSFWRAKLCATRWLFNLFKHEKEIILIQGTELVFVVNRALDATNSSLPHDASKPVENSAGPPLNWM
jgi:hypothetical protein